MGLALENVVPWGRSYAEYLRMFSLTEKELSVHILGCGDGPAAFNATLTRRGGMSSRSIRSMSSMPGKSDVASSKPVKR